MTMPMNKREDALALLLRDHERARTLYEAVETAGGDDRYFIASRILRTLDLHGAIETELFYPVLAARLSTGGAGAKVLLAAARDHHDLRKRIAQVRDVLAHDEEFQIEIDRLMTEVCRHFEQEEREIFPLARKVLSGAELMQVADDIHRMKEEDPRRAA
jgi:hemerythrin-like domain-containing protein